jgi:hypothetical protein
LLAAPARPGAHSIDDPRLRGKDLALAVGLPPTGIPDGGWSAPAATSSTFVAFLTRSRFTDQQVRSGLIDAIACGLIAVAIAEVGAWQRHTADR